MIDIASQHKQRELRSLLERGVVMIHIDPRLDGVVVPPQFRKEAALRLNVAYAFKLPAFEISDEGVYAILSFNRQNFGCTIPWQAIYALTLPDESHEGMVWPDSMPVELRNQTGAEDADEGHDNPSDEDEVPVFSVLPGGRGTGTDESESGQPKSKISRGHLTVIK